MDLKGKVAIVTGGGTGMGKSVSTLLAASGVSVAVNYSRSEDDAVATAEELTKAGVEAMPIRADVSSAADVAAMIEQTERQLGRVDILVNNAGYTKFVAMNDLEGMPEDEWDRIMDVNVKGIWLCTKAAAPAMRRAGGGAVVNVTSVAGLKVAGQQHGVRRLEGGGDPPDEVPGGGAGAGCPGQLGGAGPGLHPLVGARGRSPRADGGRDAAEALGHAGQVASTMLELIRNDSITGQTIALDAGALLP